MLRLLFFAIIVLAFGLGFSWFADRPGELSLQWQGQLFQTPLTTALVLLIALIVAVMVIWWLISAIWTSPNSVRRYFRARKRDRGYQAISTGLIAAGSGNLVLARKMSTRAHALLRADQEPLIHVLDAQVALIAGNHDDARRLFESMSEDPETEELGLRGLYLEAKRLGADEAAQQYAERAADKAPYLAWAAQATLETRTRQGRWDDAIRLLDQQRAAKVTNKQKSARLKAVLLTARAESKLETEPKAAAADALQALKLRDDFQPAAIIAAKAYLAQGNVRKSAGVLEMVWKKEPHPQIGTLYIRARGGDTAVDRLKRAEKLEALKPNNPVSLLLVARAALDAREFSKARQKAEATARMAPRESAFLLLADIEEVETGDQGRVRHWMAQALKAERDPTWVADGLVSEYWRPFSPATGKIDVFEWKTPYGEVETPLEEGTSSRLDAALKSLPPIGGARRDDKDTVEETKSDKQPETAKVVEHDIKTTEKSEATEPESGEPHQERSTKKTETPETAPEAENTPDHSSAEKPDHSEETKRSQKSEPSIKADEAAEPETEQDDEREDPVLSPFGGRSPDDPGVSSDEDVEAERKKHRYF
ncbi:heme biosynthesis protein HemY [Martelella mediterranea]|uniref:HemY protein n=1 Tax=Martelella mediterranea TaxID=293089 RepID=A0A4R3P3L0_9HYPH|nr:heme biosynthesis protein HemY [Martelella mediterranea]TCT42705.1 HemY protein [Martelella mediterranea]